MASDYECREVAERLRNGGIARNSEEAYVLLLSRIGIRPQLPATNTYQDAMARLADLIDRPTYRLDLTDVETHGNVKVRIYECSRCGRTCEDVYGKYERCPHCGGVVVEDGY